MMKFLTILSVLVLLASITCVEVDAIANGQPPLVVSRLQHGRALDIIVYPCVTTICAKACCNCNIEVIPPVCTQCCSED